MASGSNRRQRRQFSSSPPISGFDSPSTAGFTKHRRLHPAPPASPSTAGFTKHCRLHPAPPASPSTAGFTQHRRQNPNLILTTPIFQLQFKPDNTIFPPYQKFGNRSKSIAPSPLDSSIAKSS
ncbi:hypothetical protein M0R45_029907 [Rubus argutus]